MHDLCIFLICFCSKIIFDQKIFSFCWDKLDYTGSIVYLSCLNLFQPSIYFKMSKKFKNKTMGNFGYKKFSISLTKPSISFFEVASIQTSNYYSMFQITTYCNNFFVTFSCMSNRTMSKKDQVSKSEAWLLLYIKTANFYRHDAFRVRHLSENSIMNYSRYWQKISKNPKMCVFPHFLLPPSWIFVKI